MQGFPDSLADGLCHIWWKGYDGVSQGLRSNVQNAITGMDSILNTASEESIVKCSKKANCMPSVVNEESAAVPTAAEYDELNNDALDYDIANSTGGLRSELSVEYDANTRDDFAVTVFIGSDVSLPTDDILKLRNNQDENDYQHGIVNSIVDEVYEGIATMALSQAEYTYAQNRGLEYIATNSDDKETLEVEL